MLLPKNVSKEVVSLRKEGIKNPDKMWERRNLSIGVTEGIKTDLLRAWCLHLILKHNTKTAFPHNLSRGLED